ncbi:hypothetical protein DES53_11372 [Roseimicrobium gellanilyticum]|uniref:Uncharacterized protein n=1 Tax=Roseimicrobium gellanilyticum TaxID=748857 RepID=A0A366H6E7_9BACT|nr:hypothetical protein [Roseimicrobium gellanilyticum]RBP37690.1 hypothetical protein DES53_11372 [Roseimicrobium gellanilyticum]
MVLASASVQKNHALMLVVHPGRDSVMTAATMKVSMVGCRLFGKTPDGPPMFLLLANVDDVRMWRFLF